MFIICVYMYVYMYIYIYMYVYKYGIHHWRIIWSSYRKLAWVGFEPMNTEFNSHSEATLCSYSNFIICSVSDFILAIAFVSHHVCFNLKFSWGNHMSVAEWSDTYGVHYWRIIWSSYIYVYIYSLAKILRTDSNK